jgi:hypothetical protein
MLPFERSLVKRMEGRPFVLLGVNTDEMSKRELREAFAAEGITWPNWCEGPEGPIARRYQVEAFPTILVLDGNGVIRYRDVHDGKELTSAVEELLEELK